MRKLLKTWLGGEKHAMTETYADLCTIYLEKGKYQDTEDYAGKALEYL